VIHGGCTVALRAFYLGYWLGFRRFHAFGVDSSYEGGAHHAYDGAIWPQADMPITFAGKTFITNPGFALQAHDFGLIWNRLVSTADIKVSGDGLIPWIAKVLNAERAMSAAAD